MQVLSRRARPANAGPQSAAGREESAWNCDAGPTFAGLHVDALADCVSRLASGPLQPSVTLNSDVGPWQELEGWLNGIWMRCSAEP